MNTPHRIHDTNPDLQCDETHPSCKNCLKHEIHCDFAPPRPLGAQQTREPVKIHPIQKWLKSEKSNRETPRSRSSTPLQSLGNSSFARTDSSSTASSQLAASGASSLLPMTKAQYFPGPASVGTPAERLLDLRLFHHYVEMTSLPLPSLSARTPETFLRRQVFHKGPFNHNLVLSTNLLFQGTPGQPGRLGSH